MASVTWRHEAERVPRGQPVRGPAAERSWQGKPAQSDAHVDRGPVDCGDVAQVRSAPTAGEDLGSVSFSTCQASLRPECSSHAEVEAADPEKRLPMRAQRQPCDLSPAQVRDRNRNVVPAPACRSSVRTWAGQAGSEPVWAGEDEDVSRVGRRIGDALAAGVADVLHLEKRGPRDEAAVADAGEEGDAAFRGDQAGGLSSGKDGGGQVDEFAYVLARAGW